MRVHHLNCATLKPLGAKLLGAKVAAHGHRIVCHCLALETEHDGVILIDTGFGTGDIANIKNTLTPIMRTLLKPVLDPDECMVAQVRRLGFSPSDVKHIVLTHLDIDHAGGLPDFPEAHVHVLEAERDAALSPKSAAERQRYARVHFAHGPKWECYPSTGGETWKGLAGAQAIRGIQETIYLVPLIGHTRGHAGVAIQLGDQWLFHVGDAYYDSGALAEPPSVSWGFRLFANFADVFGAKRAENVRRLRAVKADGGVTMFCAHDTDELEALASASP